MSEQAVVDEIKTLLQELAEDVLPMIDPVNEITAAIYAKEFGFSVNAASRRLKTMVEEGKMVGHKVRLPNGHISEAYRKAE